MGNPIQFPNIKPSARSFTPGKYPSTDFESLDGTKTHIRFGNKAINAQLSLSFSNISDEEVHHILSNYQSVNSDWDHVIFNRQSAGLQGIPGTPGGVLLEYWMQNGSNEAGLKWRYTGPPTVTSTFNGLSNVSCSFVACLDAPI